MSAAGSPLPTSMTNLERRLEELPLLPSVVTELLSLNPDDDDYFERLLHLAERDPPFAVRVLRAANSAASAPANPILSLQQAIMRLGSRRCADIVLALAVIRVFLPRTVAQRFLWTHSLQVALLARGFCLHTPATGCNADQAYLCGLLHDIGRFVQFEGAPADLSRIDDTHWASPRELICAERSSLGYDHALLGAAACQKWALPAGIAEVVRRHHEVLSGDWPGNALVRVVQWADRLSVAMMLDKELLEADDGGLPAALLGREASIGPPRAGAPDRHWTQWVPQLRGEAARLAAQLQLAP